MNDWDLNPEKYLVDDQGNFVLKLDGTPKKKAGRAKGSKGKGYNYHSTTKAKIESKRAIKKQEKRLKTAQSKIESYKNSINKNKTTLRNLAPLLNILLFDLYQNKVF